MQCQKTQLSLKKILVLGKHFKETGRRETKEDQSKKQERKLSLLKVTILSHCEPFYLSMKMYKQARAVPSGGKVGTTTVQSALLAFCQTK